jgi:hypothetical protein
MTTESEIRYLWGLAKSTVKAVENDEILPDMGASMLAHLLRSSDGMIAFRPGVRDGMAGATLTTPENRATKPLWLNGQTARITLNFWIFREKRDAPLVWAENMAVAIGAIDSIGQWWDENIDTDVFHAETAEVRQRVEQTFNAAWGKIRQSAAIYSTSTEQMFASSKTAIYAAAMRVVVSDAAEDAQKAGDGRKAAALWRLRRMLL